MSRNSVVGFGFVLIAVAAFSALGSGEDTNESPPRRDDVSITNRMGNVVVQTEGPATYEMEFFAPYRQTPESPWCFWMRVSSDVHTVDQSLIHVRSVTLRSVSYEVEKRTARSFKRKFGHTYILVKGPDAEPGTNVTMRGTFTWKTEDGDNHFFHEEGAERRIWKTTPIMDEKAG